ncbi:YesL family protein [Caldalkalibacillus salinus]|uniref:YesL family protein n=1 Tax=Caldalkalibacillus salinus TaxID=2803787 RepID=UPI001920FA44|nr:YesL family protein [Caldalkalibacillus salinus]
MQMNGLMGGFYKVSEWIMRLAYVNLLWILFTLCGLIILGFFPATAAMFAITRKWIMGEVEVPVFRSFLEYYKRDFLKSNTLGLVLIIIGTILIVDLRFFRETLSGLTQLLYYPFLTITFFYLLMLFYVFPTFVHYDIKNFQVLKNALIIMIMNPVQTIMMVVGVFAFYYVMLTIPGLIPFFSGSVLAYVMMWFSYTAFTKVQQKKEAMAQQ